MPRIRTPNFVPQVAQRLMPDGPAWIVLIRTGPAEYDWLDRKPSKRLADESLLRIRQEMAAGWQKTRGSRLSVAGGHQ